MRVCVFARYCVFVCVCVRVHTGRLQCCVINDYRGGWTSAVSLPWLFWAGLVWVHHSGLKASGHFSPFGFPLTCTSPSALLEHYQLLGEGMDGWFCFNILFKDRTPIISDDREQTLNTQITWFCLWLSLTFLLQASCFSWCLSEEWLFILLTGLGLWVCFVCFVCLCRMCLGLSLELLRPRQHVFSLQGNQPIISMCLCVCF